MPDYLFEVYHYCTAEDRMENRKSSNGFRDTMDEAEHLGGMLTEYAKLRGLHTIYYVQQFNMDEVYRLDERII